VQGRHSLLVYPLQHVDNSRTLATKALISSTSEGVGAIASLHNKQMQTKESMGVGKRRKNSKSVTTFAVIP
jgi:hypothetical protein